VTIEPEGRSAGPLLFAAVGLLVAVVAVIGYRRRPWRGSALDHLSDPGDATAAGAAPGAAESGGDASAPPADDPSDERGEPDGPADEPDADAGETAESGDSDDAGDGTSASAAPIDDDLLSNEEQVLRLVEANGGRMKQKQVAEELDWTAAKTSQVVTGLRDEGDLDGFRLGRENVLSLPDYDATTDDAETDGDDGEE
jgi:hypothetical protein